MLLYLYLLCRMDNNVMLSLSHFKGFGFGFELAWFGVNPKLIIRVGSIFCDRGRNFLSVTVEIKPIWVLIIYSFFLHHLIFSFHPG